MTVGHFEKDCEFLPQTLKQPVAVLLAQCSCLWIHIESLNTCTCRSSPYQRAWQHITTLKCRLPAAPVWPLAWCMISRTAWHLHHSVACDAFEKGKCSWFASQLTWTHVNFCPVHVNMFPLCCALLATGGNVRCRPCRFAVKFYEGFCKCEIAVPAVSCILLRSLTPPGKGSLTEFTSYCCRFVYLGS